MAADVDSILNDLKNNKYSPIYFLQGEEPFFIDQVSDYIEKNVVDEASKGFNQIIMYGKDVSVNEVVNNARRFPMMSDRQLVLIKEAQNIKDLNKESGSKLLSDYLNNPLPSTILVFCYKYKKIDQRKSIGKDLAKKTVFLDAKKLYDNQIPDWIKKYVAGIGFKITDEGAYLLSNCIGNNLERISNEIRKVLINFKEEKEITRDHVHKYIGISKEFNVFELTKALAFRNPVKAISIVNYFAANPRENPIVMVLAILYSFFARLLVVQSLADKSEKSISAKLKIPFFAAKEYSHAIKSYDNAKLESIVSDLRNADMQIKGINVSSLNEEQILKELIFRILH